MGHPLKKGRGEKNENIFITKRLLLMPLLNAVHISQINKS